METLAERRERLAREQRGLDALAEAEQQITELRQQMEQRRSELDHARRQVEKAQARAQQAGADTKQAQTELVTLAVEPVRIGAPIALVAEMAGVNVEAIRKALDEPEVSPEPELTVEPTREIAEEPIEDEGENYAE